MDREEDTLVVRRTCDPNAIGKMGRNPRVMGGVDVIAGTRIVPAFVWSFREAGFTTEQIIEQYTHLLPKDIDEAIAEREASSMRTFQPRSRRSSSSAAVSHGGDALSSFEHLVVMEHVRWI